MFVKMVDKGVVLAVAAGGQAIGNALYDAGCMMYQNREAIEVAIVQWWRRRVLNLKDAA